MSQAGFAVDTSVVKVPTSRFKFNYDEIVTQRALVVEELFTRTLRFFVLLLSACWCGSPCLVSSQLYAACMPHKYHVRFGGDGMIIPVPIIRFMDDSLGNISKQWNKHHVVYISSALLPQEQVEKRSNIHFITSSPHATPMELTKGVQECLEWVTFYPWDYDITHPGTVLQQRMASGPGTVNTTKRLF